MEEKEKRRERWKLLAKNKFLLMEKITFYSASGAYILPPTKQNYKNNQNQKLLQGTKREENQKGTKKSQKSKISMNSAGLEQFV